MHAIAFGIYGQIAFLWDSYCTSVIAAESLWSLAYHENSAVMLISTYSVVNNWTFQVDNVFDRGIQLLGTYFVIY